MAKAKKLKSGSWRVRVFSHYETVDGKQTAKYASFTAPTKSEAEMMATKFQNDKGRFKRCEFTVLEAVEKYIESKENVLSPSTIRSYVTIKNKQLALIGAFRVDCLTNADLQHWINTLSADKSAKTVKNAYGLVMAAISLYSDRVFRVTLPARQPVEYSIPSDDDVRRMMDKARPDLKIAIALASVGTLRRGEICSLKYKDILRDFSAVYVHSDMVLDKNNNWVYKDIPKTSDSVRRVELPAEIIDMLGDGDPEDFIIKSTPAAITDVFCRLRDSLGLSCRFHDLRHYAASILHAIGVPDQYIMQRGGWSTDGTLKAVYRNTLSDKEKRFTDKANDYFSKNLLNNNA